MGIADFFKKPTPGSPAEPLLQIAKDQANTGQHEQALQTLVRAFHEDVDHKPLYRLAADCLSALGGETENQLFENTLHHFNSAEAFSRLGGYFSGSGDYYLAQAFLKKALSLDPRNVDVAHDLAIAYARRFQVANAIEALERVNAGSDFWALWFLTKCRILNNEIEAANKAIESLDRSLDAHPTHEETVMPRIKVEELKEMIARHNTIAQPKMHIRDWQFIQYGSAVLDYFDNDESYVAGGRYVASWGSNEGIKEVLHTLRKFTTSLGVSFGSVKYLDDRNSEIIGKAISGIFGMPAEKFEAAEENYHCLIVAADSASLNEFELHEVRNGQIVFALNHDWLQSSYITPDIIGFLTQSYYFPWDGNGFKMIDPGSGQLEKTEPDLRTTDEIAADIANLPHEPKDQPELINFYRERKHLLKGIGTETSSHRYNFMIESAVPGAYFGT